MCGTLVVGVSSKHACACEVTGSIWMMTENDAVHLMDLQTWILVSRVGGVQDLFSYDLNATGSCLTEDRSEQTLLFNHPRYHQQRPAQPMKVQHYSSPTGLHYWRHPCSHSRFCILIGVT